MIKPSHHQLQDALDVDLITTSTCPCVDLITQAHVHAFRHTTKSLSTAGRTIEVHLVTQAHVHTCLVRPAADDDFGMIKLE